MKTFFLFLFTGFTCSTFAQHIVGGIWEGKLNLGLSTLRIVFHFDQQTDGTYRGLMDSPDQGAKDISCSNIIIKGDSLIAEVKAVGGSFKGILSKDSVISGSWSQQAVAYALTVYRVKEVSVLHRPQTPKPPFVYTSEEVAYDNADKSIHFGGTFTYPKNGHGPFLTAILITGSGQQDRDETIFGHKPFAVIADDLTKKGFAILRIDDRGVGKTTGMVKNATSADFANDVEAGLAYLKTREEVDWKRVGLIGHSEGGLIASIVASRHKDLSFVIFLAGPGIKGADLLADQNEAILKSNGIPADAALAYKILFRKIIEEVLNSHDSTTVFQKSWIDGQQWKNRQPASVLAALNIKDSTADKKVVSRLITAFSVPWMKYFLESDPRSLIEKFHCKVLALGGSKDVQVIASANLTGINSALKKSKSPVYETKEIPGVNHLFQHCNKCTINEYNELEETFAPEVLEIMSDWLKKNVQ